MKLIDADALIEKIPTVMDMQDVYLPIHFKEWLIDEAPTIEPKRGEWIRSSDIDIAWGSKVYTCSNCEHKRNSKTNFCPNCGARMRPKLQGKHFDSIIIDECAMKGADDETD